MSAQCRVRSASESTRASHAACEGFAWIELSAAMKTCPKRMRSDDDKYFCLRQQNVLHHTRLRNTVARVLFQNLRVNQLILRLLWNKKRKCIVCFTTIELENLQECVMLSFAWYFLRDLLYAESMSSIKPSVRKLVGYSFVLRVKPPKTQCRWHLC